MTQTQILLYYNYLYILLIFLYIFSRFYLKKFILHRIFQVKNDVNYTQIKKNEYH
jgi:hypothetical protein